MTKLYLTVVLFLAITILYYEPVLGARTNRPKCYFGDVHNRIEGGWDGILQPECESRGMCWENHGTRGVKWCFQPKRSDRWDCDYANPQNRVEGGWYGISKEECEALGSCFDNSFPNMEWCLKPRKRLSPIQAILQSPRIHTWGEWGQWEFCPDNSFVHSVDFKIEHHQGSELRDDDTGLNAIKLYCKPFEKSEWGSWRGLQHCRGPALAFQLKSEKRQTCLDDSAATDFRLICPGGEKLESGLLKIGDWTKEQRCPVGTAICGIRTQIEEDQGEHTEGDQCLGGDDTALNNVDVACCPLPNPATTCRVKFNWVTVLGCSETRHCSTKITTGMRIDATKTPINSWTKNDYENMGFGFDNVSNLLKLKFDKESNTPVVNGLTVPDVFREASWNIKTVEVDDPICSTAIEVLELECGIYTIRSAEYRCRPGVPL